MDLLLYLLLFAAALLAIGWVAMWLLLGAIIVLFTVVAVVLGLVAHPFTKITDPMSKGRALKREVLLSSLPGKGRNTSITGGWRPGTKLANATNMLGPAKGEVLMEQATCILVQTP